MMEMDEVIDLGPPLQRVLDSLRSVGFHVKRSWIQQAAVGVPPADLERAIYDRALYSDLRLIGLGCLPDNVGTSHKRVIEGKFVLQVSFESFFMLPWIKPFAPLVTWAAAHRLRRW